MPEAVIVAATRSPIGRAFKGKLRDTRADDLAVDVINAALDSVPELDRRDIDDLLMGASTPAGEQGFNLARIVAVLAGMDTVPGTTLTRYCASSLQTTRMAMHAIRAGEGEVFISAGVEVVSRHPMEDDKPLRNPLFAEATRRVEEAIQSNAPWSDPRAEGRLPHGYIDMGQTAENVASLHNITRAEQDEFALRSQNLYEEARKAGFWAREITPIKLADGSTFSADESPRSGTTMERLSALSPVFRPGGTVTAGNCCPLNDGAAALVIMSDRKAAELGLTPLARIVSTGVSALSPEIMGLGPVEASTRALALAGMKISDMGLVEINEAFAAQVIPSARELGVDLDRLNVHGGGIALGHPFGMTGARMTTTLINGLRARDEQFGLETMCIGGGQGMAMVIERLS